MPTNNNVTNKRASKQPLSTSALGALIFGFLFAPLALYFGIRTYEETKAGDTNRAWAAAGIVLAALQVFIVIAFVVATMVQYKYGYNPIYHAPGPMPYYESTPGR
jgi:p-aminobenzoyl-glutamate transporter AbgT